MVTAPPLATAKYVVADGVWLTRVYVTVPPSVSVAATCKKEENGWNKNNPAGTRRHNDATLLSMGLNYFEST